MTPRFKTACLLLSLTAAAAVVAVATEGWTVSEEARALENPTEATPENLAKAKEIYDRKCAACHGLQGKGDGKIAQRMGIDATDLSDTKHVEKMTDGEIFTKIALGRDPMPSFEKKIPEPDRWLLVHYVRALAAPTEKSE